MRAKETHYRLKPGLAAPVLALALLALTVGLAAAQDPTPSTTTQPPPTPIPNETCLACHRQEGLSMVLPSGEQLDVTVDEETFNQSVHGYTSGGTVTCQSCHTDIAGYPHGEVPVETHRDLQIHYSQPCANCHTDQALEQVDSVHAQAQAAGIEEAAVCADCHGSHDIQYINREEHPEVPVTASVEMCHQCHSSIYDTYRNSVHGQAAFEGNPDVPTCIYCHPAHTAEDPRTIEFRLQSPDMCGDCHADKELMAKYGISTEVFETYVADFHGKTVMLFEKTHPGQPTNKAVCTDCHGVHEIQSAVQGDLALRANLVGRCQECHPDATVNFAESWLGHYTPGWEQYQLVTLVTVFYDILIPAVVGFFVVYIVIDAQRRIRNRRASRRQASA